MRTVNLNRVVCQLAYYLDHRILHMPEGTIKRYELINTCLKFNALASHDNLGEDEYGLASGDACFLTALIKVKYNETVPTDYSGNYDYSLLAPYLTAEERQRLLNQLV